jgi:hypothetical protein
MMIEVVLLDRSQVAKGRVIRKLWLDASQGIRTAAVGYLFKFASTVADERDLHAEAKESCRVTGALADWMEAVSQPREENTPL